MDSFVIDYVKTKFIMDYIVWYCYPDWQPTQKLLNFSSTDSKRPKPIFVFLEDENYVFTIERTKQFIEKGARNIVAYCDSKKLSRLGSEFKKKRNLDYIFYRQDLEKQEGYGVVAHERLTSPRVPVPIGTQYLFRNFH